MYPRDKNPLHPSALRLRDMNVGRPIVVFNSQYGVRGRFTILSTSEVYQSFGSRVLRIKVRDEQGVTRKRFLSDMGVIKRNGEWSTTNFTVDARKQHLLPLSYEALGDTAEHLEQGLTIDDFVLAGHEECPECVGTHCYGSCGGDGEYPSPLEQFLDYQFEAGEYKTWLPPK